VLLDELTADAVAVILQSMTMMLTTITFITARDQM